MQASSSPFHPIDFKTRLPALDGIRALAITLVFIHHLGGGSHGGAVLRAINEFRKRGWMGVDLFFVLSGFLITGILFDTRNDSHFFSRFYARRSLRILPLFYLVAAVLLALTPIFNYQWHWLQLTFLAYIGNFFGNYDFSLYEVLSSSHPNAKIFLGHIWSLCVEEQFYLLWPFVVWLVRDRIRLIATAAGLSMLALLLRCAMCAHFTPEIVDRWVPRTLPFRMDSLLFGAILALVLRGSAADAWQRASKWIFLVGSISSVAIFAREGAAFNLQFTIGYSFVAMAGAGLIGVALPGGSSACRFFTLKPLRSLGKYSYGFYIFHVLYGWAWIQLLIFVSAKTSMALGGIVALTANFIVTFLVAKLSYELFEVRFLRYKTHFEYDAERADHKHAF